MVPLFLLLLFLFWEDDMMDCNEYREIAEKFKTINTNDIPLELLFQATCAAIEADGYIKKAEITMNKAMELMKQVIVLDGINKSAK